MEAFRIMEVIMKIRILIVTLLVSFSGFIEAKNPIDALMKDLSALENNVEGVLNSSSNVKEFKKKAAVALSKSKKSKTNRIKITKAYHHEGTMLDKVVFYFSQRPICTYVPSASATGHKGEEVPVDEKGQVELEFFMPLTQTAKSAQNFLNQLVATLETKDNNEEENYQYRMAFEPDYAKGGLTCRVLFRPDEIAFHQESAESITGHHTLAFSFLKRKTMKDLNNKLRPLLQTAQVKKKSISQLIAGMEIVTLVM